MNEKINLAELVIKMAENIELLCKRIDQLEERMNKREQDLVCIYDRIYKLELQGENDE